MNTAPTYQQASTPNLPVNIAWRSFLYVFNNLGSVIRLGLLPLLLIVSANIVIYIYFPPQAVDVGGRLVLQQPIWPSLVIFPITIIAITIFMVGIHRLAILNERPPSLFYLRFQREEVKFLAAAIIAILAFLLFFGVIGGIGYLIVMIIGVEEVKTFFNDPASLSPSAGIIAYVCILIPTVWLGGRLLLALPHAAITAKIDFGMAWRVMRGNFWRYFAVTMIFSLIAFVIYMALVAVIFGAVYVFAQILAQPSLPGAIDTGAPGWQTLILSVIPIALGALVGGFIQVATVVMISKIYQALVLRNYESAA